jgi:uncharacterized protein YyaL (SSP411 family)
MAMSNRLANSTSPYLLQHADNPVDWWEWGPEAFAEAKRRDTPIFLSIGYTACHWCHVMAHESFEDPQTAADMNAGFVSVKVDREERPDVDAIYMQATVALTGHGGWPMTVFLDHDARPFFAGTYYPPQPRHQLPSFRQLLAGISEAWNDRRDDVTSASGRIAEALAGQRLPATGEEPPTRADLDEAVELIARDADLARGGFGGAPKFPPSMLLEFLLRHAALSGDDRALRLAEPTLVAMARGGMYDQLGGGFARYSVDADWVVPHFEKMLYDNALLLRVYAHWWRATGEPLAERVVRGTAGFLLRELHTPEGGFAAALDADSDGHEGVFYAWSPADLADVLGAEDGSWAATLLGVTDAGTFEHGTSTLQLRRDPDDAERWESVRARLLAAREQRTRPARDDKVVAAWNGLAIAALADAGALFDEPAWVDAAAGAADLLVAVHLGADGTDQLARTSRDGRAGTSPGVLADYGDVAEGLQALFQATGDDEWLAFAGLLLDVAVQHFGDGDGGFYDTADDAPALIHRPGDVTDDAEPSGWSAVAGACLAQAALSGVEDYRVVAERALAAVTPLGRRAPRAVGWGLAVAAASAAGPLEVALVLPSGETDSAADWISTARRATSPGVVLAIGTDSDVEPAVPLLRDRTARSGLPTAYVCRGHVCDAPTTDLLAFATRVGAHRSRIGE